jgi:error-prone DNA polymerase
VGVFQIESRAQMAMLPRLKPRTFYDLVVEVAIVRPGPIQGGMIHPYLRRRNGQEPPDPPNQILGPILDRTLGVPLFQEQVMQIAIVGAGYTGGEADQLRRDMAAWKKNGNLARHRERLARGFAERGISNEFSERLYSQIQGFAEYGFPESHASSFALLVYASSWIKVHHPAEFAAALINSQPMGFYSPSTILEDAKKHGVEVRGVSVAASDWDCTLQEGAIRVGLRLVRGMGKKSGLRIEEARKAGGPFATLEELAERASLQRDELDALAEAGALEPIVNERRKAMWKVRAPRGEGLFAGIDLGDDAPPMPPLTRAEQLVLDYERTGVSVGDHPMRLLRPSLPKGVRSSSELTKIAHGARVTTAGMVICRQRPQTASGVVFITLEDEAGFINLILYTHVFDRLRHVATTSALLTAHGQIERDGEVIYVIVSRLERLAIPKALPSMSRDFH